MDYTQDKPIILLGMLPGSPAEKAGLKVGDVLFSVDNFPIKTYDDFIAASAKHGLVQLVTVIRGNQMLDIEIQYETATDHPVEKIDYAAIASEIDKAQTDV